MSEAFFLKVSKHLRGAARRALKDLLETKHLYQSITLDPSYIEVCVEEFIDNPPNNQSSFPSRLIPPGVTSFRMPTREQISAAFIEDAREHVQFRKWNIYYGTRSEDANLLLDCVDVPAPDLMLYCTKCKARMPHQPSTSELATLGSSSYDQIFVILFNCQARCASSVKFMIARKSEKLTLVGRAPLEVVQVPAFIPKEVSTWYSKAVVAHRSGQTLAAIFLLRVVIECFWRDYLQLKDVRMPGEKMGELYAADLPPGFRSEFPSLRAIYEELSEAIHGASSDEDLFYRAIDQLVSHFDARRLFKLPAISPKSGKVENG